MTENQLNNPWRMVASAMYKKPIDSKIFGSVDLDVTELEQYIQQKRKEGLKITFTHFFVIAIARAIREVAPEFNTYVKRGKLVSRPTIDASVSVLIKSETEMGSVKVVRADQLTLRELADYLDVEIARSRKGEEHNTMKMKALLASLPWPLRGWVIAAVKRLTVDWGFSFPKLGLSANSFGTFMFSNISSLGLDQGYPALMPAANVSVVFIMGSVNTKPGVVGNRIEPRRMLYLGAALDHRVVDALHGGRLFGYLKKLIANPSLLEHKLQ